MRISRKKILLDLSQNYSLANQRIYFIEIYNPQLKSLDANIESSNFDVYYKKNNYEKCENTFKFNPGTNYDKVFFKLVIDAARNNQFEFLQEGASIFPISNAGVVYLTSVEFEKNDGEFKIIKALDFQEFRQH